jgi:RimJ/RimL family protein N-acetyltransferase
MPVLETSRLLIRNWRESDHKPFAEMNADPLVMRYFPATWTVEETEAALDRNRLRLEERGFCMWAVELKETGEFAGFIGLSVPSFEAPFTPCVEIGWRLAARFWNRGLATEGAAAVLRHGHATFGLDEIVAFTATQNFPSRRVMEKIGMVYDPADDFDHPGIPKDHCLCRHVLYRHRAISGVPAAASPALPE